MQHTGMKRVIDPKLIAKIVSSIKDIPDPTDPGQLAPIIGKPFIKGDELVGRFKFKEVTMVWKITGLDWDGQTPLFFKCRKNCKACAHQDISRLIKGRQSQLAAVRFKAHKGKILDILSNPRNANA